MNTLIKRAMLVAGISTAMALPLTTQASDGTITFAGAVTANTCTVSVNGLGANPTIHLPIVSQSALTNAATKTTAAGTFFNMAVSGCTATNADVNGHVPTSVQIYFEAGPNVDEVTGGLINNTVGGSTVEVNLYLASAASVVTTQILPGTATQPASQLFTGLATQWFYAGYSTAGTNGLAGVLATAGVVSTSVTYSLVYQ